MESLLPARLQTTGPLQKSVVALRLTRVLVTLQDSLEESWTGFILADFERFARHATNLLHLYKLGRALASRNTTLDNLDEALRAHAAHGVGGFVNLHELCVSGKGGLPAYRRPLNFR